jgi:TRAP-type C4-dicarboxylate transport system substrate-binding protein
MSTHSWERLTEQQRQWVEEAVTESVEYQRVLWDQSEQEALNAVKEHGVTVSYPDKTAFEQKVESMKESYQQDPVIYNLLEEIKKLKP